MKIANFTGVKVFSLCLFCLSLFFMAQSDAIYAADSETQWQDAVHGSPWAFGESSDRHDVLWKKGVNGAALHKKRSPRRTNPQNAANTSSGIDQALSQAAKNRVRSKIGLSLEQNSTTWSVAPEQKATRPDEEMARERRHVLRAYAGVESENEFHINFGPELILKDEEHGAEAAMSDQPDSAIGLGMKFKYDF